MRSYITIAELTRHWKEKLTPKLKEGQIIVVKDGRSDECLFEIHSYKEKRYQPIKEYGKVLNFEQSDSEVSDETLMDKLRGERF